MSNMEYETIQAAAKRLKVSTRTVYRRIDAGQLASYNVPGTRLVRLVPTEVDAALRGTPVSAV